MDCQAGEAQAHDEPLATMLRIFEPHRGIVANDFLGKRPGHEHLPGVGGEIAAQRCWNSGPFLRHTSQSREDLITATPPSRGRHSPRTRTASSQGQRDEADASRQKIDTD
jgi:hypothetical protein